MFIVLFISGTSACKAVPEVEDFFTVKEHLYCFLFTSVVHHLWIAKQKGIYTKEKPIESSGS